MATEEVLAAVTLRPAVPMGAYHGLGYVCVLGVVEALREAGLDVGIGWPFAVVDAASGETLAYVRVKAGYEEGMFARCEVVATGFANVPVNNEVLVKGIEQCVEAWAEQIQAGRAKAGPLAPILARYFDLVPLLGQRAEAVYPNGNVMASGTFAGLDIWGRATLRADDGRELEFAPEQAAIRAEQPVQTS